jgi:dinuclear metal center YbgI/SA1388 family protein
MISKNNIVSFLNTTLHIEDIADYGPQGIQVDGQERVSRVVTGVSASLELFQTAVNEDAEMVIVHHGILWDRDSRVVQGAFRDRLKILLENDITLLAYHLPLDKHPVIGNNAVAADRLGLDNVSEFADIGVKGTLPEPCSPEHLVETVTHIYQNKPLVFAFGPDKIQSIGICSGGASKYLRQAIDDDLDAYISGEPAEPSLHEAKEGRIHFLAAGHYATERLGIQALGDLLQNEFNLSITFVDLPNPV